MSEQFIPRPGALRYKDEATGEWVYANPRDSMFSTVTFMATEFWRETTGWTAIYEDGEGGNAD